MAWSDGLDGVHLDIAGSTDNPNRVMAGPGTGKSYAMKRRLMRLLEEGISPGKILAVTFTRNAAAEIVKDIRDLGVPGCEKIVAGTLHSFCFSLLKKAGVLAWTKRVARPLVTYSDMGYRRFEIEPLLEDVSRLGDFGDLRARTKRIQAFEAAWARLQTQEPGHPKNETDLQFLDAVMGWLRFHEAMLIGEVVPEALRFIENNPASTNRPNYEHVVVDEFQDLNRAEQVLLALIAEDRQYAIFGDEDQSIYSFRYAHPEGIRTFSDDYPATKDHSLQICQRCPVRIVQAANQFISQNYRGTPVRLQTKNGKPDGEFHIVQWRLPGDEWHGIAQYIKHLVDVKKCKPGDILILSPRRQFAHGMRDALVELEVPAHSFYHEEALEADEAKRALALLTLTVVQKDRVALRYLLGVGSPSWESRGYDSLRKHCERVNQSPWDALIGLEDGTLRIPHTTKVVAKFSSIRKELEQLALLDVAGLIDALLPDDEGWAAELRRTALNGGLEDVERETILERLRTHATQPEIPEDKEHVRIMSLYKSKGLTSKVVIVIGCLEGLISNQSASP